MKNTLSCIFIAAVSLLLTGCFESAEEAAVRALAQKEIHTGYEVTGIEIMSESAEVVRGATVTTRNFVADVEVFEDTVKPVFRDHEKRFAVVKSLSSAEPMKVAGVYQIASDGVDSEERIEFSRKSDLERQLMRVSELQADYAEIVEFDSKRANELLEQLKVETADATANLKALEAKVQELDEEASKIRWWASTDEANALMKAVKAEREKLRIQNKAIEDDVNKQFTAEWQPHGRKKQEELNATRNMSWSERNNARRDIYSRYRELEQEMNKKYSAMYEQKSLKTTPGLEAAEAKYKEAQMAADKRKDEIQTAKSEMYDQIDALRVKARQYDRYADVLKRAQANKS